MAEFLLMMMVSGMFPEGAGSCQIQHNALLVVVSTLKLWDRTVRAGIVDQCPCKCYLVVSYNHLDK